MPTMRVNGIDLAYETTGNDGPPLVLSHGSWGDRRGWNSIVPELARTFRVVTWDRRGHGASGDVAGQGSREQDSDDLAALVETLEIAPAHFVGNSFGGSITLGLAVRRPELFRSISVHEPPLFDVLAAEGSGDLQLARERLNRVTERLAAGEIAAGAALFVNTVVGQAGTWESYTAETQEAMVRIAPTFLDENRDPGAFALDLGRLAGFSQPALLTWSDNSPAYFGQVIQKVAAAMPNAEIHVFSGAGHVPHRSQAVAYVERLTAFLRAQR